MFNCNRLDEHKNWLKFVMVRNAMPPYAVKFALLEQSEYDVRSHNMGCEFRLNSFAFHVFAPTDTNTVREINIKVSAPKDSPNIHQDFERLMGDETIIINWIKPLKIQSNSP